LVSHGFPDEVLEEPQQLFSSGMSREWNTRKFGQNLFELSNSAEEAFRVATGTDD